MLVGGAMFSSWAEGKKSPDTWGEKLKSTGVFRLQKQPYSLVQSHGYLGKDTPVQMYYPKGPYENLAVNKNSLLGSPSANC